MQSLLSVHSDAEHGFMNCSPVEPVIMRRKARHCFSASTPVPSDSQAFETKQQIKEIDIIQRL